MWVRSSCLSCQISRSAELDARTVDMRTAEATLAEWKADLEVLNLHVDCEARKFWLLEL